MRTLVPMGRWDPQETQLVHAPKAYPRHDFKGIGTVWAVMLNDTLLGRLSYTDDPLAVVWQPAPGLDDAEQIFADGVTMLLFNSAQDDVPLDDTLTEIFDGYQVRITENAELAGLRP